MKTQLVSNYVFISFIRNNRIYLPITHLPGNTEYISRVWLDNWLTNRWMIVDWFVEAAIRTIRILEFVLFGQRMGAHLSSIINTNKKHVRHAHLFVLFFDYI